MADPTPSTTVLVGTEETTPQTQHFDTVREFDDDDSDDGDDANGDEGGAFVDVDVEDGVEDGGDGEIMTDDRAVVAGQVIAVDDAPPAGGEIHDVIITQADDRIESSQRHYHLEMSPLILETDAPVPSSPRPSSSQQWLSRRNKSGGAGEDDDDAIIARKNPRKLLSSRLACLKRKVSRESLHGYEQLSTTGEGDDSGQDSSVATDRSQASGGGGGGGGSGRASAVGRCCRRTSTHFLRTTVTLMNFLARTLLWGSFLATIVGVVWYSRELKINGTDPHLIAWFSAGAFVLLGFPISMCGIIMHLKNYYQPNVQCYVVRILWMVPVYSIESWLCLRFHNLAIYIETLRDFYESYVLYSFFQFLIEVLGGEETLVMMLKDKSPTRGAHIWGMGLCMKPWVMGQPLSRRLSYTPEKQSVAGVGSALGNVPTVQNGPLQHVVSSPRLIKRVQWTSPFFVKCKFGVLQYVLLKFVSAIFVVLLEMYGLYKEGDFTPRGGYLYICILTNLSQCWALYCLVIFYYALKNELGPIRPVGKFLSVKALVFATWWQSLGIAILFQMGLIPNYIVNGKEWSQEAVAKGLQDWLICIEMFIAAIVHTFVFPHTDYLEPLGIMEQRAGQHMSTGVRRLGRRGRMGHRRGDDKSCGSKNSAEAAYTGTVDLETGPGGHSSGSQFNNDGCGTDESDKDSTGSGVRNGEKSRHQRQGFVSALLDSTLPRDVVDQSVGIFKGDFNVEKKTLLHHAATSDEYDLFSQSSKRRKAKFRHNTRLGVVAGSAPKKGKEQTSQGVPDSVLLHE